MGLNCKGPLISGFFSVVNTTVLHDPRLVESKKGDMEESCIRKAEYKLYADFECVEGQRPYLPVVQGSTVLPYCFALTNRWNLNLLNTNHLLIFLLSKKPTRKGKIKVLAQALHNGHKNHVYLE